ncbi:MAG TPA: response regulator [Candidatus Thermoplasmatota archaeon]|nr:response regulator [Candidatus Thermoplasmatota archaeon]
MRTYLIVDDSATVRITLKAAIAAADTTQPRILEARNAPIAITEFRMNNVDVVFLDMMLGPDMNGRELLQLMLNEKPEQKVILVTGLGRDHPDVVGAVSLGAFSFVQKPIRNDAIKRVLTELDTEEGRAGRIR